MPNTTTTIDCCDSVLRVRRRERPNASFKSVATRLLREHVDGRSFRPGCKGVLVLIFGDDAEGEDYEELFSTWVLAREAIVTRITTILLKGQKKLN